MLSRDLTDSGSGDLQVLDKEKGKQKTCDRWNEGMDSTRQKQRHVMMGDSLWWKLKQTHFFMDTCYKGVQSTEGIPHAPPMLISHLLIHEKAHKVFILHFSWLDSVLI